MTSFNVVKKCFGILHKPLLHIFTYFNLSFQNGIFPDKLKIARVTSLFKGGETMNQETTGISISVLQCFSKILEKNIYNRLQKYLIDNSIIYKKELGFQEGHSTEYARVQLVDQITVLKINSIPQVFLLTFSNLLIKLIIKL